MASQAQAQAPQRRRPCTPVGRQRASDKRVYDLLAEEQCGRLRIVLRCYPVCDFTCGRRLMSASKDSIYICI
eukprot:4196778-Pleurochrysis_carterae.AAC.1